MKRLISVIASVIMCVCMLPLMSISASAVSDNYAKGFSGHSEDSKLIDNEYNGGKGIFGDDKDTFREVDSKIKALSEELQMNITVFVSGVERSDYATEIFADDTYDSTYGEDTDGVFYYLDLSGKYSAYDYISTSGKAVLMYQKHIDSIFSALDYYLPASGETIIADDIRLAIERFLDLLRTYYNEKDSGFEYYHDESSGKYFYFKNNELVISRDHKPPFIWLIASLIGAVAGGLTTLISYFVTKSNYKFKKKTNPSIYLSGNDVRFAEKSDILLRSYVTKHRIESSSGGGGRSGGGGGGHSFSGGHGGGGHHR